MTNQQPEALATLNDFNTVTQSLQNLKKEASVRGINIQKEARRTDERLNAMFEAIKVLDGNLKHLQKEVGKTSEEFDNVHAVRVEQLAKSLRARLAKVEKNCRGQTNRAPAIESALLQIQSRQDYLAVNPNAEWIKAEDFDKKNVPLGHWLWLYGEDQVYLGVTNGEKFFFSDNVDRKCKIDYVALCKRPPGPGEDQFDKWFNELPDDALGDMPDQKAHDLAMNAFTVGLQTGRQKK